MFFKYLLSICLATFSFMLIQAQSTNWMPIPLGQTSYFQVNGENYVMPMENDYWWPGGAGDFYTIYGDFLEDEFDSCSWYLWVPSIGTHSLPKCDFKGFVDHFGAFTIQGIETEFWVPNNIAIGDTTQFGLNHFLIYQAQIQGSVFGISDSIREYAVLDASYQTIGAMHLSKKHGFTKMMSVRDLELMELNPRQFELIGFKDSASVGGFQAPAKSDYLPYAVGDELILEHKYWITSQPFTEVIELHHLTISSVTNSLGETVLTGVAQIYDDQGFYISTDSNYQLDLDPMLEKSAEIAVSVPYLSDSYYGEIFTYNDLVESQDSGVVMYISAYEEVYCDTSDIIADGPYQVETYSTEYGFHYKRYGTFGPPTSWELIAANGANFTYGEWPTWLSVQQIDTKLVSVFPNPTTGVLNLAGDVPLKSIDIVDVHGRIVLSENSDSVKSIDVSNLKSGVYFLIISIEGGSMDTHRFTKVN